MNGAIAVTIRSADGRDALRIERNAAGDLPTFAITAVLDGATVTNADVVLLDAAAFRRGLRTFEQTRRGSARIEGSEGCYVAIEADGAAGHAWLGFQVARTLYSASPQTGRPRSGQIVLSGGFAVPGDAIALLERDFESLLKS